MRPSTSDIKINGITKTNDLSVLTNRQKDFSTDLGKVFSFFFPAIFCGFDKPVPAITNLAHLLLPFGQANAHAKSKELNFPTLKKGVLCTLFDMHVHLTCQKVRHRRSVFHKIILNL